MIVLGGGRWDTDVYEDVTQQKVKSGTAFGYDQTMKAAPAHVPQVAHASLDPRALNPGGPLTGKNIRESRDSDEHPNSVPIAVFFDVTGSMGQVPIVLQQKLAGLFGLLLRKGYTTDPQVAIGAYGDAHCDKVPLQVSQFESDNRIDENLDNLFLEGGGGGNGGETPTLAAYWLAEHTATDAWEKRKKRGYAFLIGDEIALDVTAAQLRESIGAEAEVGVTAKEAFTAAQERWNLYFIVIDNGTAARQGSVDFYRTLLDPEHVIVLDDATAVAETIAVQIGRVEGVVDLSTGTAHLNEIGSGAVAGSVSRALAAIGS